jgi:regulator of sigma E protease
MELILPKLIGIFGAIFLFGFAVFIHELGHFLAAKAFGIGVSKFAIGFGPKMLAKQWGETEYSIRWIPLGGFVSLKGMIEGLDEEEEKPEEAEEKEEGEAEVDGESADKGSMTEDLDALRSRPAWQRIVVFGAGVTCNYLLAIFLVAILMMIGEPKTIELPNRLEKVPEDSQMYELGWRTDDRIVDVERKAISSLGPVLEASRRIAPPNSGDAFKSMDDVNEAVAKKLPGGSYRFRTLHFLKERIFGKDQSALTSPTLVMTVEREGEYLQLPFPPEVYGDADEMEHFQPPRPAYIGAVIPDSPAHRARLVKDNYEPGTAVRPYPTWDEMRHESLRRGDEIIAINGESVQSWKEMSKLLRANPNQQITLTIERVTNGEQKTMLLTTSLETDDSEERRGQLGIYNMLPQTDGEREGVSPIKAILGAPMRTLLITDRLIYETVAVFKKPAKDIKRNVGGPIAIGVMAYREAQRGLYDYLKLFAMICIILSVMNLLPIPILDGGYIMITIIEAVIGRPLPRKLIEPMLITFFILFLILFGWIFLNDIMNWVL